MQQSTVIITGHSQGLGYALAETCLNLGAYVIGIARRSHAALGARYPDSLSQVALDLSDTQAVRQWLDWVDWQQWCANRRALWLFNNAGTIEPSSVLGTQGTAAIAQAVALNITAPLILADAVAARQSVSLSCNIVHISSGAAHNIYPGWSIYGACKAALDQHARNVCAEARGIRIVSIAPGVVDTPMQTTLRHNSQFPARTRFVDLYHEHRLQSADDTAQRLIQYCQSAVFAQQPVVDLRDL